MDKRQNAEMTMFETLKTELEKRPDLPDDVNGIIEKSLSRKINKRNVLTFGGGSTSSIMSKSLSASDKNP